MTGGAVLVTGACGTLGSALARAFAERGAAVALLDLPEAGPADLAESLATNALGVECDVSDPGQVAAALAAVTEKLGPPAVLVNNAAARGPDVRAFFTPAEEYAAETWRAVMAVNLEGMFHVAVAAAAAMKEAGGGAIVQIASIYGVVAADDRVYEGSHFLGGPINTPPVYAASKSGVIGLTRYLAARWAPDGIRVNSVSPGGIEGEQNDTFKQRYSARVPLGRMARTEEIVGPVLFLASDEASYITGHNLVVDGGLTIW